MRLFRRHHRAALDARVADARARAQDATEEAERSQVRQDAVREHVVEPLRRAAEHNQFADLIRQTLINGERD